MAGASFAVAALAMRRVSASWFGFAWDRVPAIGVVGAASDPRLPLVNDAVAFWNRTLGDIGSAFRLGAVTPIAGTIPGELLVSLSEAVVGTIGRPALPDSIRTLPGDIVIALSDAVFISFSAHWPVGKGLVAIRSAASFPLTLPNVARNVVAHELGHAIGLGHNSDPTMLMCGRPAPCRPNLFRSDSPHYFPLTPDERALLLRLYPAGWRPG